MQCFALFFFCFFFFNDTATTEIYTLSLHDALPISVGRRDPCSSRASLADAIRRHWLCLGSIDDARCLPVQNGKRRSEEHTSELQSQSNLVCRLLLEKKKKKHIDSYHCVQLTS